MTVSIGAPRGHDGSARRIGDIAARRKIPRAPRCRGAFRDDAAHRWCLWDFCIFAGKDLHTGIGYDIINIDYLCSYDLGIFA